MCNWFLLFPYNVKLLDNKWLNKYLNSIEGVGRRGVVGLFIMNKSTNSAKGRRFETRSFLFFLYNGFVLFVYIYIYIY